MVEEKRWVLEITMKSGVKCNHELTSTEHDFWAMVNDLSPLIGNDQATSVYACGGPYAVHRISEMASIHYGDVEPPSGQSSLPPMGFIRR